MTKRVTAAHHNAVLQKATKRAQDLEPRLASVLEPILVDAGRKAARSFKAMVTDHMTASGMDALRGADRLALSCVPPSEARGLISSLGLTAAAPTPTSTMIALYPRKEEADALAHVPGEEPGILHVTLAYLGQATDDEVEAVKGALGKVAASHSALSGHVGGIGVFDDNGNGHPAILLPDVPGLVELRQAVCEAIVSADADYSRDHGYSPHLTVAYNDDDVTFPSRGVLGQPLHFDELALVRGDRAVIRIPLTGGKPLTAAAGEPTPWTAPAADEIIDVAALVSKLRTKTDPVRLALIKTTMDPALENAGLSFDVTNPYIGAVIGKSGAQIKGIAETTQINVMKIIKASYDQGLSIPDTAAAISQGMAAAAPDRATLIARTELAGAVNGASLAATQMVEDVTGTTYFKTWMTAPGARFPRHEDYEGLDGQEVGLDEEFDVGGFPMDHPADPDGPAEEVCNCRCTMSYTDQYGNDDGEVDAAEEG